MTGPLTVACVVSGVLLGALLFGWWLARKLKSVRTRRRADRQHARLVAEARSEWTLKGEYKKECEWIIEGAPNQRAGWTVLFAEENSLGERRVRVIHKPKGWNVDGMHIYAQLKAWEAQAEARSLPRADRVPA